MVVDTGYLFPETYRFIDELSGKLELNLRVYRPDSSAAWQESRHGKLWDKGLEGIEQYNRINKKEPTQDQSTLPELNSCVPPAAQSDPISMTI